MIKRNARLLSLLCVISLLFTVILTGCGTGNTNENASSNGETSNKSTSNDQAKKVTLEYWSTPIVDEESFKEIVEKYTTEIAPNVEIKLTVLPYGGIDEKVNVAIAADTFPDIYSDAIQRLGPLALRGVTAPLSSYITEEYNLEDNLQGSIELSKVNGEIFMFMFDNIPQAILLNRSLFEAAGATDLLPDEKTRSWSREQFVQAVEKIGSLGNGIYGFGIGMGDINHDKFLDGFMYNDGEEYTNAENTKITYNTEQNASKYQWLVDVATSKYAVPGASGNNISNIFELFKQGKVGIMNYASGFTETISAGLNDGTIKGPLDYMFAHFPTEDGSVGKTFSYSATIGIKQQDDRARMDEAAKFALWMTSGKDELVNEAFYVKAGRLPARKSLQTLISDPEKQVLAGMPEQLIRNIFIIPNYSKIRKVWFDNFQLPFINQMSTSDALNNFERDAQRFLDEGNSGK